MAASQRGYYAVLFFFLVSAIKYEGTFWTHNPSSFQIIHKVPFIVVHQDQSGQ